MDSILAQSGFLAHSTMGNGCGRYFSDGIDNDRSLLYPSKCAGLCTRSLSGDHPISGPGKLVPRSRIVLTVPDLHRRQRALARITGFSPASSPIRSVYPCRHRFLCPMTFVPYTPSNSLELTPQNSYPKYKESSVRPASNRSEQSFLFPAQPALSEFAWTDESNGARAERRGVL
jgi:hypothetical protein